MATVEALQPLLAVQPSRGLATRKRHGTETETVIVTATMSAKRLVLSSNANMVPMTILAAPSITERMTHAEVASTTTVTGSTSIVDAMMLTVVMTTIAIGTTTVATAPVVTTRAAMIGTMKEMEIGTATDMPTDTATGMVIDTAIGTTTGRVIDTATGTEIGMATDMQSVTEHPVMIVIWMSVELRLCDVSMSYARLAITKTRETTTMMP